jgi:hypothetical protein
VRSVIVAWCKSDSSLFEKNVPLKFVGTRNKKLGFKTEIDVLFIDGYKLLDDNYKVALEGLGYRLHDTTKTYSELERKYEVLNQFGDYEKKCFLRWLVIRNVFSGERIIHFDGDIVFNECPQILSKNFIGKTFILQGCPALTVISNLDWFAQYEEELNLFVSNITGYSDMAWDKRLGLKDAQKTWTGTRDRKIISSDQDLFRHLLHTNAIYQDKPEVIMQGLDNYIFFENPAHIDLYYSHLKPFKYGRTDGIDFLNDKRVCIWHMQSDFNEYLGNFIFRDKYLQCLMKTRLQYKDKNIEYYLRKWVKKMMKLQQPSRLYTYKYFFEDNDFSELFSAKIWWEKNVFQ